MIFQEPYETSLNPVYRIKDQIMENILTHEKVSKEEALKRSIEMLDLVSIPAPERRAYDFRTRCPEECVRDDDCHGPVLPSGAFNRR